MSRRGKRALLAAWLCLTSVEARAASSSAAMNPLCVTRAGAALFFFEQTEDCGGSSRRCRTSRWAWAAYKAGAWDLEALGAATADDDASPEANAQAARPLFKASAAHPCASFIRAPRSREPDLPDSETWFQYAVEGGALVLHWQGLQAVVAPAVRAWRAGWCARGCEKGREGPRLEAIEAGRSSSAMVGAAAPAVELGLGEEALLGFSEPPSAAGERGFLVMSVNRARLREAKAELLHRDAKALLAKASGDLLASAKVAGLLDAALQLAPANRAARLDYARLLAQQGDAERAARELEHLRGMEELRSIVEGERSFEAVRRKGPVRELLERLAR